MSAVLSVGIVLQSNFRGGPQKVSTIAALDLARQGHKVSLFLPVLPYYYYYVTLGKRPLLWARVVLPYLKDWARGRKFVFQDILDDSSAGERVSVRFVPRRASRGQLKGLDCLIIHAADKTVEYQNLVSQERQIYLLWHPEEHAHGHQETFRALRESFGGRTVISSPFTARQIADHVPNPAMVPGPISPMFWDQRHSFDPAADRRDILVFAKSETEITPSREIFNFLLEARPQTTITVWSRSYRFREMAERDFPGLEVVESPTEKELCDLYLGHSMLLFPSTYEGFGMPPIEALACGCVPVLHPQVGAAELYAKDGENSVHIRLEPAETARRIADILDNPGVLRLMRVAGPKAVLPFDPNGYGLRLLEAAGFL